MGVMRPDLIMRSIIPVVMAGVLGIYGLITAVIINGKLDPPDQYSQYSGYAHLGAGLTVGMSSLAAGKSVGWACQSCMPGTYSEGTGNTACLSCPVG